MAGLWRVLQQQNKTQTFKNITISLRTQAKTWQNTPFSLALGPKIL